MAFVVGTVALKKVSLQVLCFPILMSLRYRSTILLSSITDAAYSQKYSLSLSKGPNKKITQILANTYDMEVDISYIYIVSTT